MVDVLRVEKKDESEAKVVPEAQRCIPGFGVPQVQSGYGMQIRCPSRCSNLENMDDKG